MKHDTGLPPLRTSLFRCQRCGYTTTLATDYPARAPHGPDKTCRSDSWELVAVEQSHDEVTST